MELREDGKYWLGNTEVNSGDIITGDNQKRYKLELRSGVWLAVHQPDQISVPVGDSGQVLVLFQLEDDTYYFGNMEVQSGDTVTDDAGNEYMLTLDSTTGMWTAMFQTGDDHHRVGRQRRVRGTDEARGRHLRTGRPAILDGKRGLYQRRCRLQTGLDRGGVDAEDILCYRRPALCRRHGHGR